MIIFELWSLDSFIWYARFISQNNHSLEDIMPTCLFKHQCSSSIFIGYLDTWYENCWRFDSGYKRIIPEYWKILIAISGILVELMSSFYFENLNCRHFLNDFVSAQIEIDKARKSKLLFSLRFSRLVFHMKFQPGHNNWL